MEPQQISVDISIKKEVEPNTYEIPIGFVPNMKVPGRYFATPEIYQLAINEIKQWEEKTMTALPSIIQIAFVATLDGVSNYSMAMPDMHSGYGFSIGGVAAFDLTKEESIVSPGGVGNDINCGVRCLVTNLTYDEIEPFKEKLVEKIYENLPCGVGGTRKNFIGMAELNQILVKGAKWCVENKYGVQQDLDNCEENGCMSGVNL